MIITSKPLNPVVGQMWYDQDTCSYRMITGMDGSWATVDRNLATHFNDDWLCQAHPGLAELREQMEDAIRKYEEFKALCREYDK